MNRRQLTAAIARRMIYSERIVDIILTVFLAVVSETLQKGEHVKLGNLGKFVVINPNDKPVKLTKRQKRERRIGFIPSKQFVFPDQRISKISTKNTGKV